MKLREMKNSIQDLGRQIREKSETVKAMAMDENADVAMMKTIQGEMEELVKRQDALKASYKIEERAQAGRMAGIQDNTTGKAQKEEDKPMNEIRKSNEYAQAFCYAIRNGLNRRSGRAHLDQTKILYDALSEGGGTTPGEDGGFLVPIDIDNRINELRRELNPLAPLFNEENVTAPTGWRVIDTAPTTGMPSVEELGTISNNSDQPAFAKVSYALTKYGMRLPVSNELLADEAANLMAYISRWFARKLVLTENGLLLTALKTLTASALGSESVSAEAAIKAVLNKALDPAISNSAVIITNQSGYDALDQLTDEMGRGLLQPDPTNATQMRIYGRQIFRVSDAHLPNVIDGANQKAEFFIGDGKQFATLFRKDGFEVSSTDVGGDAWAKDMTEVRGIARLAVTKFDTYAMVRRQLTL